MAEGASAGQRRVSEAEQEDARVSISASLLKVYWPEEAVAVPLAGRLVAADFPVRAAGVVPAAACELVWQLLLRLVPDRFLGNSAR